MDLRAFAILSCTALVLGACGAGDEAQASAGDEELWFEILHAGVDATSNLLPRERFDALPRELAQSPADVLCVQGVADPADRAALRAALVKVFPTSLDLPTDDASTPDDPTDAAGRTPPAPARPPCADVALGLQAFGACVAGCTSQAAGPVLDARCADDVGCWPEAVLDADPERRCPSCMADHLRTGSTVAESAARCSEMVHPLSQRGQHGMMLLSKLPLSRPSIRVLPSEGTRRAILAATVTTKGGAEIDVVCASLGPTQESALPSDPRVGSPYPGPYGSPNEGWLRENELHVEQLGSFVAAHRESRPAVVLGNFGTSAEVVRGDGVALPAAGPLAARRLGELFVAGVAPSYSPSCTVCAENPLVTSARSEGFQNRIYLAGLPPAAVRTSMRSYLGDVVAPRSGAPYGRAPVSMQYGFRSKIAVPQR